jgi:hypothetical protein
MRGNNALLGVGPRIVTSAILRPLPPTHPFRAAWAERVGFRGFPFPMISRHDRLRLHGLDSLSRTIRARELHEVLSALPATSERADRVLV